VLSRQSCSPFGFYLPKEVKKKEEKGKKKFPFLFHFFDSMRALFKLVMVCA
jgi:hypothetical protein